MSTRRRSEDDFRREIQAHIELETERLIADGMAPEDARVAARRRFGNVTAARERFHEARTAVSIERFVQDLRCAVRNMRRYPVASLIAILSLAVGLAATTVSLTIRDVIFHRPPATYQQPDQLSKIQIGSPENPLRPSGNPVPVALYARWRAAIGPSIAAHLSLGERDARVADRTESVRLHGVTPELFATLGRCSTRWPCVHGCGRICRRGRNERDSEPPHVGAPLRPAPGRRRTSRVDRRSRLYRHRCDAGSLLAGRHGLAHLERAHPERPAAASCQHGAGRNCAGESRHVETSPRAAPAACAC